MNDFSFNRKIKFDVSGNPIINANILPSTTLIYDLGSPDKRWNDLYLSGNTIDLSGTLLSRHTDGSLMVHDSNSNMVNLRANNIIAEGNLTVSGTTTTINSTTVTVQDPIITLGSNIFNTKDKGIEFKYGTSKIGFFGYDDSTGNLTFLKDASNNSEVFSGTQGTIEGSTFKSSVVSGTAPLTVTSSTLVTNLNADLLDGLNSDKFMRTDISTSTIGNISGANIFSTGNIGIGTITPQGKLEVYDGSLRVTSSTNNTTAAFQTFNGTFLSIEAFNLDNTIKRSICLNAYGGNVGIGTNNPQTKLHISGIIKTDVPSFYVRSDTAQTILSWGNSTKINYNLTPSFNRFNLYNTSTKRLVPVVNGLYYIYASYSIARVSEVRYQYIVITKNAINTDVSDTFSYEKKLGFGSIASAAASGQIYPSIQATAITELLTSDYVEVYGSGQGDTPKYNAIDDGNIFMAYLITAL